MTVWYTADLHLGHRNIIRYCDRPFEDVATMHDALVERWNAVVAPEDTVWVLGDVAMRQDALPIVGTLAGHKILVAGNHDSCWDGHGRAKDRQIYLDAGFAEVVTSGEVRDHRLGGHTVMLSHLPYRRDEGEPHRDRYFTRRPVDDGTPLLHGHIHELWKTRGLQINVGVDVWDFAPVAAETLEALFDEQFATAAAVA